jgi:hypothetical protein
VNTPGVEFIEPAQDVPEDEEQVKIITEYNEVRKHVSPSSCGEIIVSSGSSGCFEKKYRFKWR